MAKHELADLLNNIENAVMESEEQAKESSLISHPENISVDKIIENEDNIFELEDTDEQIQSLADSIETNGLIHRPAVSYHSETDEYLVLSGHRRIRAMRDYLGYEYIPCEVYDNLDETTESLILYDANIEVRDISDNKKLKLYEMYAEKLKELKQLGTIDTLRGFDGSIQRYIAKKLDVTERQVRTYKNLSEKLTEEEKQQIEQGQISVNEGKRIVTERKEEKAKKAKEPKVYSDDQQEYIERGRLIYDVPNTKKDKGFACEFPKGDIYEKLFNYEEIGSWQFYEFLYERHKDEYKEFLICQSNKNGNTN